MASYFREFLFAALLKPKTDFFQSQRVLYFREFLFAALLKHDAVGHGQDLAHDAKRQPISANFYSRLY